MNIIFKVGNVVQLKSGGEKMTIDKIEQQYKNGVALQGYDCTCVYFIGNVSKVLTVDQLSLALVE